MNGVIGTSNDMVQSACRLLSNLAYVDPPVPLGGADRTLSDGTL